MSWMTWFISRLAQSSSLPASPEEPPIEAHMKVRSLVSRLKAASVRTGSSNWMYWQPAAFRSWTSSRRTLTISWASASWDGYTLSETPWTHIERVSMYGPGSGTLVGLSVCFRRNSYSSRAIGWRRLSLPTTVAFLILNAGTSSCFKIDSKCRLSSTRSISSASVISLTPSSFSVTNE